jgi:hypothetical protein
MRHGFNAQRTLHVCSSYRHVSWACRDGRVARQRIGCDEGEQVQRQDASLRRSYFARDE